MRRIALLALAVAAGLFAWDASEDLLAAARAGDLAAVKSLVEKGAPIEAKTTYGQTPLYLAAMNGHEPVVAFLLEKGAAADVTDTFYKAAMLSFVMQRKHYAIAKLLIPKISANPDQMLAGAVQSGQADLVQAVVEKKPGQTALNRSYEMAMQGKQAEIAAVLKKAGAREPAPAVAVDPKVLETYAGSYKAEQFPAEIKVFVRDGKLFVQATGQSEFAPKPVSQTHFEFAQAQLEIDFDAPGAFTLKQGGGSMKFKKAAQ